MEIVCFGSSASLGKGIVMPVSAQLRSSPKTYFKLGEHNAKFCSDNL